MEKIKSPEKVTNVLECIGQKRTLLNNILRREANCIGHILRRNYLKMMTLKDKVKGVGRRRTQLADDLRNRRRHWELESEAKSKNMETNVYHTNVSKQIKFTFHKSIDILTSSIYNHKNERISMS